MSKSSRRRRWTRGAVIRRVVGVMIGLVLGWYAATLINPVQAASDPKAPDGEHTHD